MSQENVELVRRLQPPPNIDLVALFGASGGTAMSPLASGLPARAGAARPDPRTDPLCS